MRPPPPLTVETEREADGRWVAEVRELPGVLAYGRTETAAVAAARELAQRVLADREERGNGGDGGTDGAGPA